MLPDMTPAVARALDLAQAHAHGQGATELGPVHLLDALLAEEEGRAALLVIAAGLDWPAYRRSLTDAIPPAPATSLPLHARVITAFAQARETAVRLTGEATVASEVILLALLRSDTSLGQYLEAFGLRPGLVEAHVLAQQAPPIQLDEPLQLTDVTEQNDLGRILDASANRAREGLRVIEDYCRFVLDDAFLSGEMKRLRHDLTEALGELSSDLLLQSRETQRDVGTQITTAAEQHRHSLLDVVQANCKRVQEALRTLEEFGKVAVLGIGSPQGQRMEELRYKVYTLERAIVLGTTARERLANARLYVLLSGSQCLGSLQTTIVAAVAGGADAIQLREKGLADAELIGKARAVRQCTREAAVLFIMNDRPDIARLVEADGVHIGQGDLPVKEVRRIVGPDALIGVSTHSLAQVRQAVLDGASYIGVGPAFPTATKTIADYPGPDFIRQALAETSLPAFVIGGVNLQTVGQAVALGARRIAVSQAIAQAEDPQATARALRLALGE
jgi:thiamine-phosphate pyrophosphorylase